MVIIIISHYIIKICVISKNRVLHSCRYRSRYPIVTDIDIDK